MGITEMTEEQKAEEIQRYRNVRNLVSIALTNTDAAATGLKKVYGGTNLDSHSSDQWVLYYGDEAQVSDKRGKDRLAIVVRVHWDSIYGSEWRINAQSRIEAIDEKGKVINTGRFLGPEVSRHGGYGETASLSSGHLDETRLALLNRQVAITLALGRVEQVANDEVNS